MEESRTQKSIQNIKINSVFYILALVLQFFTRKIFLDNLGADFLGLTGTLSNILGYLNLTELGIGAAISYNLYKPLQQNNRVLINELISLFGFYYRIIGLIILGASILLSFFIPLIFKDSIFTNTLIVYAFYSILCSILVNYFINYRTILLTADQRNYIVVAYTQGVKIAILAIQLLVVLYTSNFYLYLTINLVSSILCSILLKKKVHAVYPWLRSNISNGKRLNKQHPEILKLTKQVFIHKIKDFILTQSDQLFIFIFVSLSMVAYYGNYIMIIQSVTMLIASALDSINAGVGNLVAEGNKQRIKQIFWQLISIRLFIGSTIVFCIYSLTEPFISLWVGKEYVLTHNILILLCVNTFIQQTRGAVDMFNGAYGHYNDTWAAWAEGIINIVITFSLAPFLGISGILLGKTISLTLIIVIWKPIYLYRKGFKEPALGYWKEIASYYVLLLLSGGIIIFILNYFPLTNQCLTWGGWILQASYVSLISIFFFASLLLLFKPSARSIITRFIH